MPEISRFYGIIIKMFYEKSGKHSKPHIHVYYGEYEAVVAFDGEILSGDIPGKQYKLLMQWMVLHKSEIELLWESAMNNEPLWKVAPYDKNDDKPDVIAEDIDYGEDKSGFTHIVSVQPLSNRMLLLQFSTGRKKLFDTTLLTGPVFEPLNSEEIFRNIVLDHGVVTWKDGTIDCEPEYMYTHGFDYTMVS